MKKTVFSTIIVAMFMVSCLETDNFNSTVPLPQPVYTLVFDQGTANEQTFESDYAQLRWLCQHATIMTEPVQGDGAVLQGAVLGIPVGFATQDNFTFDFTDFYFDGDNNIYPEAVFVIDDVEFHGISGTVTITDFDDSRFENEGYLLLNGTANLTIETTDGMQTRSVKITFANILRTHSSSC